MRPVFALCVLALLWIAPSSVAALDTPASSGRASMGLAFGYGSYTGDLKANPYSITGAIAAGYSFDFNLYVGGFTRFFIGLENKKAGNTDSASNLQGGATLGYDLGFGEHWVLRPQLGVGAARFSVSSTSSGEVTIDEEDTALLISPGVSMFHVFDEDGAYFGAEAHYCWVSKKAHDGYWVAVNVGVHF